MLLLTRRRFNLLLLGLWVAALLALPVWTAGAQGAAQVTLRRVDVASFPQMRYWFGAVDAQGAFLMDLKPEQVLAVEDEQPRPVDDVQLLKPGVRFIVAVNLGPQLALRDAEGISRLEKILQHLDDWASRQPADSSDLVSLIAPSGQVAQPAAPAAWRQTLAAYQPDARNATPDVRAFSLALDAAQEVPENPLMQTVILWITPHLEGSALAQLSNQQQRALTMGVPVFVLWVDSEAYNVHSGTQALQNLAEATQGAFYTFAEADFPDPDGWLENRRYVWQADYYSGLKTSGDHSFKVVVTLADGQQIVSGAQNAALDIQPPNPIFITPPAQIVRQMPPDETYDAALLTPRTQGLDVLIEFPDGHPRSLVRTSLYVDDQIVAENYAPPFDHFEWDLSGYTSSASHVLRVEAVDDLGLSQITAPLTITVTVLQPPKGLLGLAALYSTQILVGALTVAGLLILAVILSSWWQTKRPRRAETGAGAVPTRPVQRKRRRPRRGAATSGAFLERMQTNGGAISLRVIPLDAAETTIGTDPVKASFVLDDPSASPLHARIIRQSDGAYRLFDADSVAGTWCNYAIIPQSGYVLQHGDVIHFGQVAYRFFARPEKDFQPPRVLEDD